jgi:energy-converting hydrogenase Eha subunit A
MDGSSATVVLSWDWQDLLTALGFMIGIISAVITAYGYIDQRRSSKDLKPVVEMAKLKIDWDLSQEKIKDSQHKIKNLEDQLNKQIPALARIAFLKNQAEFLSEAIGKSYSEWKKIEQELRGTQSEIQDDKSIESVILDLIPEYDKQKKRNALKDRITILGIMLVFFNNILPNMSETFNLGHIVYDITKPGQIIAAILLLITIIQLYTIDKEYQKMMNKYASTLFYSSVLAVLLSIGIIAFLLFLSGNWEFGLVIGILEFVLVGYLYYLYTKGELDRYIQTIKGR